MQSRFGADDRCELDRGQQSFALRLQASDSANIVQWPGAASERPRREPKDESAHWCGDVDRVRNCVESVALALTTVGPTTVGRKPRQSVGAFSYMPNPDVRTLLRTPWVGRGLLVVAIALAAVIVFRDTLFGVPVATREVKRADIVQTIVATGRVMTPLRVSVGAVITERVARIPVDEGQSVRAGDVLIVLDDRDERAALAQARAAVDQAEARLRQLSEVGLPSAREGLAQAEANLRLARQQYERNEELHRKGFISAAALDDARRNLDVAQSQLAAAKVVVATNLPSGSDHAAATSALAQARATLAAALVKLEQTVIRAPADGVLIAREVEAGDVVQPGHELMVLAPAGETQIDVRIDEKHLAQLEPGQHAFASADAVPAERFAAVLFYINPGVDSLRGSVEIKLRVPDPPAYLRQDMTVSVDIEVARHTGTLVAPADCVLDAVGPHPWVLAVAGHRAVRRSVTLGLRGEGHVEILSGITEGERLVPALLGVVPGQRIRPIAAPAGASS